MRAARAAGRVPSLAKLNVRRQKPRLAAASLVGLQLAVHGKVDIHDVDAAARALASPRCVGLTAKRARWGGAHAARLAAAMGAEGHCVNLTSLNIGRNHFGDEGATRIAEALEAGRCAGALATLDLYGNRIADAGATRLSAAVATGCVPHLTSLHLNNNAVGDPGAAALAGLLESRRHALGFVDLVECRVGAAMMARVQRGNDEDGRKPLAAMVAIIDERTSPVLPTADANAAASDASLWFHEPPQQRRAQLPCGGGGSRTTLLFCFPHAGGGPAAFEAWPARLAASGVDVVPVCYPGRHARAAEPAATSVRALADGAARAIAGRVRSLAHADGGGGACCRYALFGHSLGGLVAYCCAERLLATRRLPPPAHVFVSSAGAPHLERDDDAAASAPLAALSDAAFVRRARARGWLSPLDGAPAGVAADVLAATLPALRSDVALYEAFAPADARALFPRGLPAETAARRDFAELRSNALHCTALARILILAQCSAVP